MAEQVPLKHLVGGSNPSWLTLSPHQFMLHHATAKEINKLDKLAIKHGLQILQMMEIAGWHILPLFKKLKIPKSHQVTVVCGKGNKAGDGLCAARHLNNHGWSVNIILLSQDLKPNPLHHLHLLKKMKLPIYIYKSKPSKSQTLIAKSQVIIDALIGYQLKGNPRGDYATIIDHINKSIAKIIAYDIPTGIDATTGKYFTPCIKAHATLTLALPKKAFKYKLARKYSGKTFLADIGIPKQIYDQLKHNSRPPFASSSNSLIRLH